MSELLCSQGDAHLDRTGEEADRRTTEGIASFDGELTQPAIRTNSAMQTALLGQETHW